MKKSLDEVLAILFKFELDNKDYIDNSGMRWLLFVRIKICKLYGLNEEEIKKKSCLFDE